MSHKLITGQKVPEATFLTLKDDNVTPVTTSQAFGGKRVVVFGLPGAFTPGCSKTHCPSYVRDVAKLKAKGIEHVYCTAVNDPYVLDAWGQAQNAHGKLEFLADGNAEWAKKTGLFVETGAFGGTRSNRYALVLNDGVVEHALVEDDFTHVEKSTADAVLAVL